MIVDAQIHIWKANRPDRPWPTGGRDGRTAEPQRVIPLSAAEVLAAMDAAGVDRAILVPPSWEGDRNDLALAAAAAHPDRFAVMGRIPVDITPDRLARWREQPGMLGIRTIFSTDSAWVRDGAAHWLWRVAADADVPIMIAPSGNVALLRAVAEMHPKLSIIVDHMGARVHRIGAEAFADIEAVLALARLPNVAVKATSLPSYSAGGRPWADVTPYLRRLFDAFGAERLFWGSDLSRLPCPYGELVDFFRTDLPWLSAHERELILGKALLARLRWL